MKKTIGAFISGIAVVALAVVLLAPSLVFSQAGQGTISAPVTNPLLNENQTIQGRVMQSAAVATGNGNIMDISRSATFTFQVLGTFTGTVTPEVSLDNFTTAIAIGCSPVNSTTNALTMTTANIWRCNVAGYPAIRVRVSVWSSGTITVRGYSSSLPFSVAANTPS